MNVPARFRNALLAVGLAAAVGCSSDDPKSPTAPPTTPVPPVTPVTYAVTVSPSKSVLTVNTSELRQRHDHRRSAPTTARRLPT